MKNWRVPQIFLNGVISLRKENKFCTYPYNIKIYAQWHLFQVISGHVQTKTNATHSIKRNHF